MDDPYEVLGVAHDASGEEIRRAYRKLAKQHHPDLNPGNTKAEERFKAVSAANQLLSDPEKRGQFDRGEIDAAGHVQERQPSYGDYASGEDGRSYSRARSTGAQGGGPQAGGWSHDDVSDMFGSMFGRGARSSGERHERGEDEHYALTAEFKDAVLGANRRMTLPDGRTLEVRIPPGIADGQTLRLRGQGGAGWNGGESGDALIKISIAPHPFYTREGQDLRLELPVTLAEAVLGGSVEVPTPAGTVRARIPPGSDTATQLRLRGKGVAARGSLPAGDLYARLRVEIGKPDAALEDFLREWKPPNPVDPRQAMKAEQ